MAEDWKDTNDNISGSTNSKSLEQKINEMHAERRTPYEIEEEPREKRRSHYDEDGYDDRGRKKRNPLLGVVVIAGIIILGFIAWIIIDKMGENEQPAKYEDFTEEEQYDEVSARELELQQQLAMSEFENLEREFSQYETSQQQIIVDDAVKQELQQKYEQARQKVEELRSQLKEAKNKSAAEIQQLNDQIKTLRELLKHYLEEIDRLNKENEQLRAENQGLRQSLDQTSTSLAQAQKENENLNERMSLAEKLNVTGVSMSMLNKKSKAEKKIKNATQFVINFTIPQNNSTPAGPKNIYAVITTPEGQILEGAGSFSFDGSNVPASARKQIDYGGEEIGGIKMYYDIRNALSPGTYSIQLFCDGYALMSRPLDVNFGN